MVQEVLSNSHLFCRIYLFTQNRHNSQGEWKCLASNDFGHSVTAASVKLVIPRHYKKPVFLEPLRAVLSQEGTVNLECKVRIQGQHAIS